MYTIVMSMQLGGIVVKPLASSAGGPRFITGSGEFMTKISARPLAVNSMLHKA